MAVLVFYIAIYLAIGFTIATISIKFDMPPARSHSDALANFWTAFLAWPLIIIVAMLISPIAFINKFVEFLRK